MKTTKSKDGTTLAYDIYGSGPPLIYITGAICFRKFGPIVKDAKVFGEAFSVTCYDRRGRGESTNVLPYSIERELEDIEALIDAAGGQAFVYGHSSGAVLALEAAQRLPDKVVAAALFDASYVHDSAEREKYARQRTEVNERLRVKDHAGALKHFLISIGMPKAFVYLLPLMPGWKTMKALAPTLAYDMELTAELPPLATASRITIPTCVMYGEKSPAGIHAVARQLAGAIPTADLRKIEGQDHMVNAKVLLPLLIQSLSKRSKT